MVNIVVAGGAGVFQLFDMETVWNRNIVRIKIRRSLFDIKDSLVTTDAIWIDLIEFGRKTCMLPFTFKGEDIDTRHQGMTCRMTLRAINLGVHGGLFPKR